VFFEIPKYGLSVYLAPPTLKILDTIIYLRT
jgi:hypothetical protein